MAIKNKEQCPEAFAFLQRHKAGSVATLSEKNTPQSALIFYLVEDDFSIVFATRSGTRKFRNITRNPNVSFTVAAHDTPQTVQMEGTAAAVTDSNDIMQLSAQLLKIHTSEAQYYPPLTRIHEGELTLVRITPTYIRWTDYATERDEAGSVWSRRILE